MIEIMSESEESSTDFEVHAHRDQSPAGSHPDDSLHPDSESSKLSSLLTPHPSPRHSSGDGRKRKLEEASTQNQSRVKRLKKFYSDGYRQLFNATLQDIAANDSKEASRARNSLTPSQIGVTVWSPKEKNLFFRALARRGRHDVQGLAADLDSKSASEISVYLDLLQNAALERQLHGLRKGFPYASSTCAAAEIGQTCCAALDLASEALGVFQQREEEKREKTKHSEFALLTPRIATWVDRRLNAEAEGEDEVAQMVPAAGLLNLKNFLTLSKRFFMNSSNAEDNWRCYTEKGKSPSIMYTAFSDLHALSVSITQRVVQSSCFIAMSRLRAMDTAGQYTSRRHVKRQDVVAALNVLSMQADGRNFWARTARKHNLRVFEKVRHQQAFGKEFSYEEVETILNPVISKEPEISGSADTDLARDRGGNSLNASSADSSLSGDDDILGPAPGNSDIESDEQERSEQSQDADVEANDQHEGQEEERRLWKVLGQEPAKSSELGHVQHLKKTSTRRRNREAPVDWKSWVNYIGEWEGEDCKPRRYFKPMRNDGGSWGLDAKFR